MLSIAPCRSQVSDRFPVASFDIAVPRSRYFEVACATDPRLFHTQWQRHRNSSNFYSSRSAGLLRATDAQTAWFLPPDQLRRFAGARRIYYALGSYGSPRGTEPEFSISPEALEAIPSISLAADFTGRTLDRTRLFPGAPSDNVYGAVNAAQLRWGGDDYLEAQTTPLAVDTPGYDDGHSPDLWRDDPQDPPAQATALSDQPAYDEGIAIEEGLSVEADEEESEAEGLGCHDADDSSDPSDTYGVVEAAEAEEESDTSEYAPAFSDDDLDDGLDDEAGYGGDSESEPVEDAPAAEAEAAFEDAAALYGAVGFDSGEGGVAVEEAPPEVDTVSAQQLGAGRDPDYRDEDLDEEELPAGSAARALAGRTLEIADKVRLVRKVAIAESGPDSYWAINPDNEYNDPHHPAYHKYHIGLSWGLIQFTQRSGALGRVLQKTRQREEAGVPNLPEAHRFEQLFGPDWNELLQVTNAREAEARVGPVGGVNLWEPAWTTRFRAAGRVPHVQYAQNEVAVTDYVNPNLRIAAWLGFDTDRALALLIDRCIHMGNGGGTSWIMRACGPIRTQADREAALRALGHADLRAFQRSFAPHLAVDGRWGPRTHAAMTSALRALGNRSPVPVLDREDMLRRLVEAARPTRFARRVAALHESGREFFNLSYDLV